MKKHRMLFAVLYGALVWGYFVGPVAYVSAAPAQSKEASQVLVSINKADAVELESIKGIGPMLAQRILDYRSTNGPFKQLEDLVQVPGIGQAKFEKIKSQLSV
jgi:competence protein ComEA